MAALRCSESGAGMENAGPKHLVLWTINAKGHGFPMLQLGRVLSSELGFRVSIFWPLNEEEIAGYDKSKVETERLRVHLTPSAMEYFLDSCKDAYLEEHARPFLAAAEARFGPVAGAVADFWFFNTPWIRQAIGGKPVWSWFTSPLSALVLLLKYKGDRDLIDCELPCHGHIVPTDLSPNTKEFDMREYMGSILPNFRHTDGMIVNDAADWYSESFMTMLRSLYPDCVKSRDSSGSCAEKWDIHMVGPLAVFDTRKRMASSLPSADDAGVMAWLDSKPAGSVVYVALGSVWALPRPDLHELAAGLAQCGKHVLWVHRAGSAKMLDMVNFSRKPPAGDSDEATGLPRDFHASNVLMAKWVNQVAVLSHPAVAAFMTHCGWNSTLEAVTLAAVPLLCLPIGADQMVIAKFLSRHLKLAVQLWDGPEATNLTADKVLDGISQALGNSELKQNALKVQQMLLSTVAHSEGNSYQSLRSVFNKI